MNKSILLVLCAVIFIIASCKKDKTTTNSAIQGNYKFKSAHIISNSTITGNDGEKAITVSDYTTINNAGTIVIDGSNINSTGLTYEVDATANGYIYQDDQLIDSFSSPFNYVLPAANSSSSYKLISADSIYFPHGSIATVGIGSMPTGGTGGKYSMSGNLLIITQRAMRDSTFTNSGVAFHSIETAEASVLLEKQ